MLKPFQIRDLYDPCPQLDSASQDSNVGTNSAESSQTGEWYELDRDSSSRDGNDRADTLRSVHTSSSPSKIRRPGVVQISAREYDETLARHPQSSLSYMDDDDGETVTVGSSFELAQRLDEPVDSAASLPSLSGDQSPYRMISTPIHIFDIRRSGSTLDLWRSFEKRTFEQLETRDLPVSSSPRSSVIDSLPTNSRGSPEAATSPPNVDTSTTSSTSHVSPQDIRLDWLQACEPPCLPPKRSDAGPSVVQLENPFAHGSDHTNDVLSASETSMDRSGSETVKSSCNITEEGKRQAQEAGARFRNWKRAPTRDTSANSSSSSLSNPWSSYTKLQARLDDQPSQGISQVEAEPQKSSSTAEKESQPLLAAFEAQMSKIVEEHSAASQPSRDEVSTHSGEKETNPTPSASTERVSPESRPPPAPVDVLAQAVNHMVVSATRLSTELTHRLPEIEQQLSNAPGRLPNHVERTVQGGLKTIGSHIHVLANAAQDASIATRQAAERTRAADNHAIERAVAERLRGVAGDLTSIGRSIFSSLETSLNITRPTNSDETPSQPARPTSAPKQQAPSEETKVADSTVPGEGRGDDTFQPQGTDSTTVQDTAENQETRYLLKPVVEKSLCRPEQPSYQATSSEALPEFEPRSTVENGTSEAARDFSGVPIPQGPQIREHRRPERRERCRSPSSLRPHFPPGTWGRRGPTFPPWPNMNPHSPARYNRPRQWWHPPSFAPFSDHSTFNPTEVHPGSNEPTTTPDTLFLGIPGFAVTEADIRNLLAEQGFLAKIHLPIDSDCGAHFGFAYLKFPSIYAARAAKDALQGAHLGGNTVNVEFSHGVDVDALQADTKRSSVSKPENGTGPAARTSSTLHRNHPCLALGNAERSQNLKSKPSVTFAEPEDTTGATTSIKRHRSVGSLPLASGGPFPYRSSKSPMPSNRNTSFGTISENTNFEYVKRPRETQNSVNGDALLDQEDADPGFSARYPSLVATKDLRRANTVNSSATKSTSSKPLFSPESELARFPSVSQLEAQTFGNLKPYAPPKPTTTLPQESQLSDPKTGTLGSEIPGSFVDTESPSTLPGSWPQGPQETSMPDLNGQPVQVDGRNKDVNGRRNMLQRSNSLVASDPAARLAGPFDPDHELGWGRSDNLPKRSATERRPNKVSDHINRFNNRPYRRLGDGISGRSVIRQEPSWENHSDGPGKLYSENSAAESKGVSPLRTAQPEMSYRIVPEPDTRERTSGSPDPSNSKIDACVDHLKALGFHNDGEGGEQRLRIYACAVDGNLGDAIEMIEEERKAYEQQPSLV